MYTKIITSKFKINLNLKPERMRLKKNVGPSEQIQIISNVGIAYKFILHLDLLERSI